MKRLCIILCALCLTSLAASAQKSDFSTVRIAAHNATKQDKKIADLVCTGQADEDVFYEAIRRLPEGGTIKLSGGDFIFDSVDKNPDGLMPAAIVFPNDGNTYLTYNVEGITNTRGESEEARNMTKIKISDRCYDALDDSTQVAMFRCVNNKVKFNLSRLVLHTKSNNKPLVYVNGYYSANINLEEMYIFNDDKEQKKVPNPKSIAVWGTNGSNPGVSYEWKKVYVYGCHEGFRCCGEHLIIWQCGARYCYYGYSFEPKQNSYGAYTHPITLINCHDELNAHMPFFGPVNGEARQTDMKGSRQAVTMIDYNLEWSIPGNSYRPEEPRYATEAVPGMFKGSIEYTIQSGYGGNSKNDKLIPFWAEGSGHGFVTRNQAHELAGPSEERRSYSDAKAANYMQTYYDTDLQKMLVFDGKIWRDFNGNPVD